MATVKQLREVAADRDIEGASAMSKDDLILALGYESEDEADVALGNTPEVNAKAETASDRFGREVVVNPSGTKVVLVKDRDDG